MGLQSRNQYNWVKNALSGDSTYTPIQGAVMCCETWKHCQFAADLQELEMHFDHHPDVTGTGGREK